jgi:signal peptidase II
VTPPAADRVGRPGRWAAVAAVGAAVLAADQATKWWALRALADGPVDVVGPLQLRLVHNTGSAFSIGAGSGPVVGLLALAVVVVLLWTGRNVEGRPALTALGLVLGGAVGNLVDRALRGDGLLHGAVVDFVDLGWWPVFNVADAAIVLGSILLVVAVGRADDGASAAGPGPGPDRP